MLGALVGSARLERRFSVQRVSGELLLSFWRSVARGPPGQQALRGFLIAEGAIVETLFQQVAVSLAHLWSWLDAQDGHDLLAVEVGAHRRHLLLFGQLGDALLELDNGARLREGPAIVQYIADQVPEKNLAPANGSFERYKLQEWLNFIGTEIHKGFGPLFKPTTPENYKPIALEALTKRLQWVDQQLAGKSYLMGEQFSVADAYLYTVSRWAGFVGLDLSGLANILAFQQRMAQRPAVQAALKIEGQK